MEPPSSTPAKGARPSQGTAQESVKKIVTGVEPFPIAQVRSPVFRALDSYTHACNDVKHAASVDNYHHLWSSP